MSGNIVSAINDFQRMRRRAALEQILSRLTGRSSDLLSYEEVRRSVGASQQVERGLQDVPLDTIVGSVGRYKDFTRTFLPKESTDEYRWANVKALNLGESGLPPVDLYKIGDAYFVADGNHRVSVAKEMGLASIQAYVTEVMTRVPVGADLEPDDLIIAEQYAHFLGQTELDVLRPGSNLLVTVPGKYQLLLEHIETHHYFMGIDYQKDIAWEEAVGHWYDNVYLPTIRMVRERGIMNDFPKRTDTDFYIWLAENRAVLEKELGWDLSTEEAVDALSDSVKPLLDRLSNSIWSAIVGEEEPSEVELVQDVVAAVESNQLFADILVSVGESPASWFAFDQSLIVAQKENGRIRGLHYTPLIKASGPHDEAPHEYFHEKLAEYGVTGRLADESGDWSKIMTRRSAWTDLFVLSLDQPPDGTILTRLTAEWRQILQISQQPVLAVPGQPSPLSKALIAYNGLQRAKEALTIGAYLAIRWHIPLVVTSIGKPEVTAVHLEEAQTFLGHFGLTAEYVAVEGKVDTNLLVTLESHGCDFLIMGGSKSNPLLEMFLGGTVEHVLRNSSLPVMICP